MDVGKGDGGNHIAEARNSLYIAFDLQFAEGLTDRGQAQLVLAGYLALHYLLPGLESACDDLRLDDLVCLVRKRGFHWHILKGHTNMP